MQIEEHRITAKIREREQAKKEFKAAKKAGKNAWEANTLEWTTDSPPPHGNWPEGLPNCYRGPYEYSVPGREDDYWPQDVPPDTAPAE